MVFAKNTTGNDERGSNQTEQPKEFKAWVRNVK